MTEKKKTEWHIILPWEMSRELKEFFKLEKDGIFFRNENDKNGKNERKYDCSEVCA